MGNIFNILDCVKYKGDCYIIASVFTTEEGIFYELDTGIYVNQNNLKLCCFSELYEQ